MIYKATRLLNHLTFNQAINYSKLVNPIIECNDGVLEEVLVEVNMKNFIRWKELLPIYRGVEDDTILIDIQEHNFIEEDRIVVK